MTTAVETVSSFGIPDELTCIGDHNIQYCTPSGRDIYLLAQGLIIKAIQEHPGVTAAQLLFQQMLRVVEVPQQNEIL